MNPIKPLETGNLEYGIIGILKVQAVKHVGDITDETEIERNIHTRRLCRVLDDVVIFGAPEESGQLEKYLPIGEQRSNNYYYLRDSLVDEWGGLCKKDGTKSKGAIQMSNPVRPCDQPKFFRWWDRQNPRLIQENNP
jgi:hypothetical protein